MSSTRYLGVDLSTNLNFNTHINRISSNANKSLGFIKRNVKTKYTCFREAAYKTIVRPQLEYASIVWSHYTQTYFHKIEIPFAGPLTTTYDSVSSLFGGPWAKRRADARLCMLYTIMHGLVAIQLPPYFKQPSRMILHSHPLAFRQIHASVNYSYSSWLLCNGTVAILPTLPQFSVAVRSLDHQLP